MAERMLKFTTVERTTPAKRAAAARAGDFVVVLVAHRLAQGGGVVLGLRQQVRAELGQAVLKPVAAGRERLDGGLQVFALAGQGVKLCHTLSVAMPLCAEGIQAKGSENWSTKEVELSGALVGVYCTLYSPGGLG